MAIDIDTPQSPGWWMNFLWQKLRLEQPRYDLLSAYRRGHPPLPSEHPAALKAATVRMIKMAQLNVADLVVQAMVERMQVRSLRTAVAGDDNGDSVAMAAWRNANLPVIEGDVYQSMTALSVGYVACALRDNGVPVATFEDPRQMITEQDPTDPEVTRAAFKIYYDPVAQRDYAILWLPGQKWVSSRPVTTKTIRRFADGTARAVVNFMPTLFTMHPFEGTDAAVGFDDVLSEQYDIQDVLVVPFLNRGGVGEYEDHLSEIDSIHHVILQGIVTATFQAFKQRALQVEAGNELPEKDEDGNDIDYNELLSADPGALWLLPIGAKIWESGQVDMSGMLNMAKDALNRFASVTRTPFSMFSNDATNQSAEGAQLSREGLVWKTNDRETLCNPRWARVASFLFQLLKDPERGDASKIIVDWMPVERYSLAEKAQADSQALSLPDEQKWRLIWQMTPDEIAISSAQKSAQLFRQAALAAESKGAVQPSPQVTIDEPAVT